MTPWTGGRWRRSGTWPVWCGVLALVVAAAPRAALAQDTWRAGQADVLTSKPVEPEDLRAQNRQQAVAEFARRYQASHRPALALFWNRELSDKVHRTQVTRQVSTYSAHGHAHNDIDTGRNGIGGAFFLHDGLAGVSGRRETVTRSGSEDDNHGMALDQKTNARLESAFTSVMRQGGARFVDRNVMLRGAASAAPDSDTQASEMHGLTAKARWLLEVTLVPDSQALFGIGFNVKLKDIASAALIVDFYTQALPPRGPVQPARFVAAPGGYWRERPAEQTFTIEDVGQTLAVETMRQVAAAPH